MVYNKEINDLAAAMASILEDDSYRSIFERPQIKTASILESKKNPIEQSYKQLVESSTVLEELGFVRSAELALYAVETLVSEAAKDQDK